MIESRVQELSQIFAIAVGGFSVMDNHLHVLLRLDPDVANGWSDEEVVRRWGRALPARDKSGRPLPLVDDAFDAGSRIRKWVAKARQRLQSLSWFMKCLKELGKLSTSGRFHRAALSQERRISGAVGRYPRAAGE